MNNFLFFLNEKKNDPQLKFISFVVLDKVWKYFPPIEKWYYKQSRDIQLGMSMTHHNDSSILANIIHYSRLEWYKHSCFTCMCRLVFNLNPLFCNLIGHEFRPIRIVNHLKHQHPPFEQFSSKKNLIFIIYFPTHQ